MKLFTKIIIIGFIGGVVGVAATAVLSYRLTKNSLQESTTREHTVIAQQTIDKIDRLMYGRLQDIQEIAANDFIISSSVVGSDTISFQQEIDELTVLTGPWDALHIVDENGEEIVFSGNDVQHEHDHSGVHQAAFDQALLAMQNQQAYYSDIILPDDASEEPTIYFSAPIRNKARSDQPIIGAVVGELAWPVVQDVLYSLQSIEFDLLTQNGILVETSTEDDGFIYQADAPLEQLVDRALISPSLDYSDVIEDESENLLAAAAVSKGYLNYKGNKWVLVLKTPTQEAFRSATSTAIQSTVFLALIMIATVLVIFYFIGRFFLQPVVKLTAATASLASGGTDEDLTITSNDEIGQLARTFRDIWKRVQQSKLALEQRVEERTKELQNAKGELEENVGELELNKKALMNVMEDLNLAKEEVENQVRERTKELIQEREKLVNANLLMTTLVENMPIGVSLAKAPSGELILMNSKGNELMGRKVDPKTGLEKYSSSYHMLTEDGKPYPNEELPVPKAMRTGEVVHKKDLVVEQGNGNRRYLSGTAAPIKDKDGKVIEVVAVFEDITEAYAIDKAKTEFVSLASHQLRTPLSAMNWYTEMLISGDAGKLNKDQKEFLGEIYNSSRRMVDLVNNLLNVSRIELGTFSIDPEPLDLCDVLENEASQLKMHIEHKHMDFQMSCDIKPREVSIDRQLISIVMQNLFTNAIKYTPEKGKIVVKMVNDKKQKGIVISVADNGYGIPKTEQDKIFGKMYRAENIKHKDTDGNGLGLYMVKEILEKAGCKIWFESKEDKGSTFYVLIPDEGMKKHKGNRKLGDMQS